MPTPLPIADAANPAETAWSAFLSRRERLSCSMHLHVCDGCDGCGGRCTAGFLVTREEHDAVQSYLAASDPADVSRVATQNKVVPWIGAEDTGAGSETEFPTVTLCRYRDTERGNCSVYPARPTICRLFGQTAWLPCPIEAVPDYPVAAPGVWNAYRHFERHTWEDWDAVAENKTAVL